MKTLVAYATKYGMTGEYARAMAETVGEHADVLDLASQQAKNLDLSSYGMVILGSSVYAGQARPQLLKFIKHRAVELESKDLALFLCGLGDEGEESQSIINKIFPETLRAASRKTAYLPGWLNLQKANGFERFIIRMVEKEEAKKGKKPSSKPDIEAEARVFIQESGLCEV